MTTAQLDSEMATAQLDSEICSTRSIKAPCRIETTPLTRRRPSYRHQTLIQPTSNTQQLRESNRSLARYGP